MSTARALWLVSLVAVLANSTWFSATAVVPALDREWHLHASGAAWLIAAAPLGFIAGSVGAALLNLPDRIQARRLIAGAAIAAAAANAALLPAGRGLPPSSSLRGRRPPRPRRPVWRRVSSRSRPSASRVFAGAIAAGRVAERIGRTTTTSAAMLVSGRR